MNTLKKLIILISIGVFFIFAAPQNASAQGKFRCQDNGGLCSTVNINCQNGYIQDTAYCAAFNGNSAGCTGAPQQDCISNDPIGARFKCVGPGSCTPCTAAENCPYNSRIACETDPDCDPAGTSFNKVFNPVTSSCSCTQVSGTGGAYTTLAACQAAACNTTAPGGSFNGFCPGGTSIQTAIGCIPFDDTTALVAFFLRWGFGVGGGIALLMILYAGFQIITSAGDPKRLQTGQELITSAVAGLILMVFSIFLLRMVGVNILGLF